MDTDISEELAAAIFGLGLFCPEGNKGLLKIGDTYRQYYTASHSISNCINFMLSHRD
jgi:hypothetical protein